MASNMVGTYHYFIILTYRRWKYMYHSHHIHTTRKKFGQLVLDWLPTISQVTQRTTILKGKILKACILGTKICWLQEEDMFLSIFCLNFIDPIAEIPHPNLMTSPVSKVLIFYCAFLKLYFVTVVTIIFQTVYYASATQCWGYCMQNTWQPKIMLKYQATMFS